MEQSQSEAWRGSKKHTEGRKQWADMPSTRSGMEDDAYLLHLSHGEAEAISFT